MTLFDAHCHLQDTRYGDAIGAVLERAQAAGVERMLCCGTAENDWPRTLALCRQYSEVVPAFGLHPWHIRERSANWLATLTDILISEPRAVVGEIGLDHALKERDDADQMDVFLAQLRLARELNRPACIHCRQAWEPLIATLSDFGRLPAGFLIHSYSGSAELVAPLADLGAYFSFSGSITRSGNKRGHKAAAAVPVKQLLIETDSPDLMPVIEHSLHAQELNEPANLVHVLRKIAALRNMSEDAVARATWEDACRLLGIDNFTSC